MVGDLDPLSQKKDQSMKKSALIQWIVDNLNRFKNDINPHDDPTTE